MRSVTANLRRALLFAVSFVSLTVAMPGEAGKKRNGGSGAVIAEAQALANEDRAQAIGRLELAIAQHPSAVDVTALIVHAGEQHRLAGNATAARDWFSKVMVREAAGPVHDSAELGLLLLDAAALGVDPRRLTLLEAAPERNVLATQNAERYTHLAVAAAHAGDEKTMLSHAKKALTYAAGDREVHARVAGSLQGLVDAAQARRPSPEPQDARPQPSPPVPAGVAIDAGASDVRAAKDEVGTCGYRAVLFGAQAYADPAVPDLYTPNKDIALVAGVLRDRYGFQTETFPNATRQVILDRIERLQGEVSECDAVLVYYAGHGELDDKLGTGFWLPVDARHDSKANWISNDDVATRVRALPARHVLLLADSCFAGSLFRAIEPAPASAPSGDLARAKRLAAAKSRVVVTSGGEEPVADQYMNSGASVFAYFLHRELSTMGERFVTPEDWFFAVRDRVMDNAHQQPQLGRLFGVGHEGGALVMVNPGVASDPASNSP